MSCSDPDTVAPAPVDDTNNDVPAPADNPLKRKTPPTDDDDDDAEADPEGDMDPDADADADAEAEAETEQRSFTPGGEYESGRVSCDTCGLSVSFRDEETGGFSLKQWQEHKESWWVALCVFVFSLLTMYSGAASGTAVPPSPMLSTLSPSAHPPAKRRRAKRTEEERKAYLGSDPYVERFEAYRVLCKSCDKWIRLRPNSTYCSIPWDAHRKSCLAKKMHVPPITTVIYLLTLRSNSKNVYALEERNALFSKDPDVRKFDAERVLCNLCDNWLPLNPDNHLVAVQAWLQHRAACQHARPPPSASPKPEPTPPPSQPPNPPSPPFHDLNPANYAPAHESRRRNAEQRAATLRADSLIAQVEPNRVFCSLCQKWVQLRQDSSYCAYPWLQHRGKCLARHQRRAAKAAEVAEAKARKLGQLVHPPSSSSAHPHSPRRALRSLSADLELESEDERVDIPEDVYRRQCRTNTDTRRIRIRIRIRTM
ncbi:hypothetical protein C0989_008004 [Termitomyces sp. Mn162]|nr:hypothetical protein C0989_008004 [Termitomyces sp. Mn162]